ANLNNLGAVAREHGDLVTAESHFRRSLAIKQRLLGPDNSDAALTAINLAAVLHERGQRPEAATLLASASESLERSVHPSHPHLAACRALQEAWSEKRGG